MDCRSGCGACCIAPGINSAIPGMPAGKPPGVRCVQLDEGYRCRLYGLPERPTCCEKFGADFEYCGSSRDQALSLLTQLERRTR